MRHATKTRSNLKNQQLSNSHASLNATKQHKKKQSEISIVENTNNNNTLDMEERIKMID